MGNKTVEEIVKEIERQKEKMELLLQTLSGQTVGLMTHGGIAAMETLLEWIKDNKDEDKK